MQYDFNTPRTSGKEHLVKWRAMEQQKPNVGKNIVPLSVADMEFPIAPEIIDAIQQCAREGNFGYTVPTEAYFEAVAGWMETRHGLALQKEWILLSPGVVTALYVAVKAYSKPGEGIMIMPPVYHPFYSAIEDNERTVVKSPLKKGRNGYEIDFDDLERKTQQDDVVMLLLCSPHNPVGRVWTEAELTRIAEICLKNNVLIVADEIHNDLIMPGYHHHMIQGLSSDVANRCITCTAPSKTFNLAGAQTSNIIISNPDLRRRFEQAMKKSGQFLLNTIGYAACQAAYEKCEGWLEELLRVLDGNKRFAEQYVQENISMVPVAELQGTYLQWYDFTCFGLPQETLDKKMVEYDLFLDSGAKFGVEGQGFERLNLACPRHVLEGALERMARLVESL